MNIYEEVMKKFNNFFFFSNLEKFFTPSVIVIAKYEVKS